MFRFRTLAAGLAAAALVVIASATPAAAHDKLASSSPKAGEALAAAPAEVELVFTGDVLTIGAIVVIADAEGDDWVDGEPTIEGTTVTAPVRAGMPEAGYEVRWRAVSGDGHAISGVVPFTIGDAAPLVRSADAVPAAGAGAVDAVAGQTTQDDGALRLVLIGAGGALVALAVLFIIRFLTRRRHSAADGDVSGGAAPTRAPDDAPTHL